MKRLLLGLLLSFHSFAGVTVISDLDDTIKITNAGNLGQATISILSDRVFTGMPEFLKSARSYSDSLHVVTAGPKIIKKTVERLLRHHNIQVDGVHLRKVGVSKLEFKVKEIVDIMNQNSDDVLLFGDDVDLDPEVFTEVKKQLGARVIGAYIHVVKNRKVPEDLTRYWTSVDLALREHLAGRMETQGVSDVIATVMKETKLTRIFPKFANCPKESVVWEWQLNTMFSSESQELSRKLNEFCRPPIPK